MKGTFKSVPRGERGSNLPDLFNKKNWKLFWGSTGTFIGNYMDFEKVQA
jgi:hypothetical protein